MKKPRTAAASALVPVVLLLGACGAATESPTADEIAEPVNPPAGDVSDPTANAADPGDDAPAGDDAAADDSEEAQDEPDEPLASRGTVEVAGTTYQITELRRCDPYEVEMFDVELELQGFGEHDGQRVQIDVYVQKIAGQQFDDVSWAGPEGVFGGPEDALVDYDGDTVSGTATLLETMHQEAKLPVTFDLEVPSEILDCR